MRDNPNDLSWQEKLRLANSIIEKKRASDKLKLELFHRSWFYKVMAPLRIVLLIYILCVYFSPAVPFFNCWDRAIKTNWYTYTSRRHIYTERRVTFEKIGTLGFRTGLRADLVFTGGEEALIQRNILLKPVRAYNLRTNQAYTPVDNMAWIFIFAVAFIFLLITFFYRDAASIRFNKVIITVSFTMAMGYQLFA